MMNDETQETQTTSQLRPYWRIFAPLFAISVAMIKFPIQIQVRESLSEILFYGGIGLFCWLSAILVWIRFRKKAISLIIVILACSILAGWQVYDLGFERDPDSQINSYCPVYKCPEFQPFGVGWAIYSLRNDYRSSCRARLEHYYGNRGIVITTEINRNALKMGCGG